MIDTRAALERHLGESYAIERELTGGGMATVFVARDLGLNRLVVIKVLPAELAAAVSVERFRREIMLSAALQHPHIVPVLSAGEVEGLPYFVMPYIDGESLRARLTRGPLAVREAVSVMRDVARALQYAHSRDVVHRDIKPDNILLSAGSAVVTDFGVAKALASSRSMRSGAKAPAANLASITAHGIAIGTPAYMAPEQAAGDPDTDHRADLYALGVVAWEMLAGTAPFHGASPQQVMASQLVREMPPIATRRYDIPRALARIVDQLVAKKPADRPRSAADLIRLLDNPEVVSGAFAAAPRALPWRRWLARGVAVIVVAALAIFILQRLRGHH